MSERSEFRVDCPHCGQRLVFRQNRPHCPRCDYWKETYGGADWQRHAWKVNSLLVQLKTRFPQVIWTTGLGAASADRLDIPPDRKGEADIKGWWMRNHFISIEVSGSDLSKVRVPPNDIWLRPDKINVTDADLPYYFVMVYPTSTCVVPLQIVRKYSQRLITPDVRGRKETYIAIPANEAQPAESLFQRIAELLRQMDPRVAFQQSLGHDGYGAS